MKKVILVALALLIATSVSAATYLPTDNKCSEGDHPVWNNANSTIISCIPDSDWTRPNLSPIQDTQIKVARGQSVLLRNGIVDICPLWFPMDCVVDSSIFVAFRLW